MMLGNKNQNTISLMQKKILSDEYKSHVDKISKIKLTRNRPSNDIAKIEEYFK